MSIVSAGRKAPVPAGVNDEPVWIGALDAECGKHEALIGQPGEERRRVRIHAGIGSGIPHRTFIRPSPAAI